VLAACGERFETEIVQIDGAVENVTFKLPSVLTNNRVVA